jgi:hypothetical protein
MRNPDRQNVTAAQYATRDLGFRATVLPETIAAYDALTRAGAALGVKFGHAAFGGAVRTAADTVLAMKYRRDDWAVFARRNPAAAARTTMNAWRPIAEFGSSFHNFGAAFDVFIIEYPDARSVQWAHDQLDTFASKLGLRTGDSFRDEPHFELAIPLSEARLRYAARGSLQCPCCSGKGRVGYSVEQPGR